LSGQQQRTDTVPSTPNGITTSFKFMAARYGGWLRMAFDSIPSSKYAYRPTPAQQSVGYIAQHLEEANYGLCERLGVAKHVRSSRDSLSDSVKATWPKDTLVARLRESFVFCDAALARLTDARLNDRVPFGPAGAGLTALPSRSLLLFVTDLAEHYSQVAIYMRLIGLVPPSALPPKPRTAIALPVAALSRYVGTYDLPPSVFQDAPAYLLDVTLKDSALYLRPRGRSPVRLWPETATDFFVKEIDAQITFLADAKGNVTGLKVNQNGESRSARKLSQ
jgi:hypothetical protein